jgi:parallel beta-helix repeat protein
VGIAVEHGHSFVIRNNRIRLNGEGVRLWTRGGPVVQHWPGHEVSYEFLLENNLIEANHTGFYGYTGPETTDRECHGYQLRGNTVRDNRIGVRFARVHECSMDGNTFIGNIESAIRLEGKPGVALSGNRFEGNARDIAEVQAEEDTGAARW